MVPETKHKLEQTIKNTREFLKVLNDDVEEIKKRLKEIEAEAREQRKRARF